MVPALGIGALGAVLWSLPVERAGGLEAFAAFIQPYCPGGRLGNIVTAAHIQRGSVAYDDLSGVEFHG